MIAYLSSVAPSADKSSRQQLNTSIGAKKRKTVFELNVVIAPKKETSDGKKPILSACAGMLDIALLVIDPNIKK
jgi:hypothetical protein